ncbi:unnamed protein product [Phaeothamnion confervicola]
MRRAPPTNPVALPPAPAMEGEYVTLSGTWVLNKHRSDTMEGFLRIMGVAELAIEAQLKSEADHETRNVIRLDLHRMIINKRSKINTLTEFYDLFKEKNTPARNGTRQTMVALKDRTRLDGIVVTTTMPTSQGTLHLVESRQLVDRGHAVYQELQVTNLATGGSNVTRRYWRRVPVTDEDEETLLRENLQAPVV